MNIVYYFSLNIKLGRLTLSMETYTTSELYKKKGNLFNSIIFGKKWISIICGLDRHFTLFLKNGCLTKMKNLIEA